MSFKRREDMSNSERIKKIIARLRQNEKYRAFSYNAFRWWYLLSIPLIISTWMIPVWIGYIIICGCIIALCTFAVYKNFQKRDNDKVTIEANFNREEMILWAPERPTGHSPTFPKMGKYIFMAYYVEGERTYMFRDIVRDEQDDLYRVLLRLRQEGTFPKIKILVNPNNYTKYKMLGYKYIEELLEQNIPLVKDELDDYYGDKWKYIKA